MNQLLRYIFLLFALSLPAFRVYSQDEGKLFTKSNRDTFYLREVPDSIIFQIKNERAFAYANDEGYWKKLSHPPSAFTNIFYYLTSHTWIKWVFLTGFTILLLALLGYIIRSNQLNLFYSKGKERIVFASGKEDAVDYGLLIEIASSSGDFRLAVRYHFLQTLQVLNDQQIVIWHPDTTNQQYLASLKNNAGFDKFRELTHIYEHTWYGGFKFDRNQYVTVTEKFLAFNRQIN